MATPYLGEIRIVSFIFAPHGWAQCNGQLLPINQNQPLFALLGTTYGGDGRVNFALPDLRGRVAMHNGNGFSQGETGGEASHVLQVSELPAHTHPVTAVTGAGTTAVPTGNRYAVQNDLYAAPTNLVGLIPTAVSTVGGTQAHENRQPYVTLNFCIALSGGIFPSQ